MTGLTTAEEMALLVLRRDEQSMEAARGLARYLIDETSDGSDPLPVVRRVTCPKERLRCVFFVREGYEVCEDRNTLEEGFRQWVESGRPMALVGIDRIEIYEISSPTPPQRELPGLQRGD